ncbi:MAG TPA: energy transducer TonB [Syntrophorhabdaceae bacterium]|nr:energy transducer TonB [Syntrophorhabdaceae bacterium]
MITVVLDGSSLIMGSGEGGGKSGSTPEAQVERTVKAARAKETKRPVKTSHRPDNALSEAAAEKKTESAETISNNFSEVVSDTASLSRQTAGVMNEGGSQVGGGWGNGQGTGGSGMGGTGKGRGAGFGNKDGAGDVIYIKKHFAFIRDMILKNLTYPAIARRMGWKGNLTVSFVICEGGSVENIRVVRSSGRKVLDENALSTIRAIQPFPKPPVRAEILTVS